MKRGPLSAEERAKIVQMATCLKNPKPGIIALRLDRHEATVNGFMIKNGLVARQVRYIEGGYTRDEDAFMVALRIKGERFTAIARALEDRFGTRRRSNSVQMRLTMLATYEGGPDA